MAAPVLESINPSSIDISSGTAVPVTITGTGFLDTSVLVVDGADGQGTFVSDTEMTANLDTYAVQGPGDHQIAVRNDAEVSNELTVSLTGNSAQGDPGFIPDAPPEGASPNTPAVRAEYMSPEPPDVYRDNPPVQFTAPGTTAPPDGTPRPHTPAPEELLTTNAHEDGGLPTNPREPYPTGSGPENAGDIKGV